MRGDNACHFIFHTLNLNLGVNSLGQNFSRLIGTFNFKKKTPNHAVGEAL